MAHVQKIPDQTLQSIAKQIASRISTLRKSDIAAGQFSVTESFPVWVLGLDATTRPAEDLNSLARRTGYWHHQIWSGTEATHYARSRPEGPDPNDWALLETVETKSAARISQAIDWIDSNVSGDPDVRMLVIPAYYMTCFWLVEPTKNEIVVADRPAGYGNISYQKIYSSREFLETLAKETPVMVFGK
jgi:hypothetical protein